VQLVPAQEIIALLRTQDRIAMQDVGEVGTIMPVQEALGQTIVLTIAMCDQEQYHVTLLVEFTMVHIFGPFVIKTRLITRVNNNNKVASTQVAGSIKALVTITPTIVVVLANRILEIITKVAINSLRKNK
jgi:hypothetical protein